ncbi:DUF7502 family protein [Halobellus litoreus]|uniref:DUF7502 family protein n=1 Tax=Halobellus litoreus TaxID=755310 RepID=UPI00210DB24E|nr:hypothetical protein [Halobellus litoreus]
MSDRDPNDDHRFDADPGFPVGDAAPDASDDRTASDVDGAASDADEDTNEEAADPPGSTARIRAALDEVRTEVRKAAVVHAAVDAAFLALLANLAFALVEPSALAVGVSLPGAVVAALRAVPVVGEFAPRAVDATSLLAVALGVVAFAGEYALRLRRPLVEQFESANPQIREALRTARDAVDHDADTEMARRLYADVVETLGRTSTLELVEKRRVAVTVVLVVVVSLASVQVAVVDPNLAGLLGNGDGGPTVERPDEDDELRDGDAILGDPEDVQAGDEFENISVPGTGEGEGDAQTGPGDGFGGGGGSGEFDSQQAGFAGEERIEDAELVREYNLRIRELDDERNSDGPNEDA